MSANSDLGRVLNPVVAELAGGSGRGPLGANGGRGERQGVVDRLVDRHIGSLFPDPLELRFSKESAGGIPAGLETLAAGPGEGIADLTPEPLGCCSQPRSAKRFIEGDLDTGKGFETAHRGRAVAKVVTGAERGH
jgi:hypothetical protein